jgi:hypothetical protein
MIDFEEVELRPLRTFKKNTALLPPLQCQKCGSFKTIRNGSSRGIPKIKCKECNGSSIKKSDLAEHVDETPFQRPQNENKWLTQYKKQIKKVDAYEQHLRYFLHNFIEANYKAFLIIHRKETKKLSLKLPLNFFELKQFMNNYIDEYETKHVLKKKKNYYS